MGVGPTLMGNLILITSQKVFLQIHLGGIWGLRFSNMKFREHIKTIAAAKDQQGGFNSTCHYFYSE